MRTTQPAKLAMGLRKMARTAMVNAAKADASVEEREKESKIVFGCCDRLMDILGISKRPAATAAKGMRIDLATILEAHPAEVPDPGPCTAQPVTEAVPPGAFGPSEANDVLPPKQ
ncbi:MAG: hypothetical protein E6Q97_39450 [Desulfurellales bacterium]|nr:MAG: hypothetical protein E6Q97_39450 [Desulfurellales bacterium]